MQASPKVRENMYVCICNGVTERRIRQAVAEGCTSFDALQEKLAVSTCCGCCEEEVREILADCLQTQSNNAEDHSTGNPARKLEPALH